MTPFSIASSAPIPLSVQPRKVLCIIVFNNHPSRLHTMRATMKIMEKLMISRIRPSNDGRCGLKRIVIRG